MDLLYLENDIIKSGKKDVLIDRARKKVFTGSSDRIDFKKTIPAGTIIELVGKVIHIVKIISTTADAFQAINIVVNNPVTSIE